MKTLTTMLVFLIGLTAFAQKESKSNFGGPPLPDPLFFTGFEADSIIQGANPNHPNLPYNHANFEGEDNITSNYPSNWHTDLTNNYLLGNFDNIGISYNAGGLNGGTTSQRLAEVVSNPDPDFTNSSNNVFYTWARNSYLPGARIQPSLQNSEVGMFNVGGTGYEIFHYSIKFYLPEVYNDILNDTNFTLERGNITILQLWNDAEWITSQESTGYRLNATIMEQPNGTGGSSLNLAVEHFDLTDGTNDGPNDDYYEDTTYPILIGAWNTLDVYFKEGDANNGKYRIKLNGIPVFNLTIPTHHPSDTNPAGLTHISPFELYVNERVIEFFNPNNWPSGQKTEIYWDDFKIYGDSKIKRKYIKVEDVPNDVITNNNLSLSANWIPGTTAGGLPYDWLYVFWIDNRSEEFPNNIIHTMPGQKSRHLDLSPYIEESMGDEELMDGEDYRCFVAVRNHPFLDLFGPYPVYHMDFTVNLNNPIVGDDNHQDKSLEEQLLLYPNPTLNSFKIEYNVLDNNSKTEIYITDNMNRKLISVVDEYINNGIQNIEINSSEFNMEKGTYFCVFENGNTRIVKQLIIY